MNNTINFDPAEGFTPQIKELFRDLSSPVVYDTWVDTFDIEIISPQKVVIAYHGPRDAKTFKAFKKECKETLFSCIYSVLGSKKKIEIANNRTHTTLPPKAKKNLRAAKFFVIGMIFVCIATAVIVVLCNYIGNRNFRETFYNTSSIKVDSPIRVIQLSDLHSASFGENNGRLLDRVAALKPDIIICTGDMVDSVQEDADEMVAFAQRLASIAPAYYVYGNNEVEGIYDVLLNEKELDEYFGFDQGTRDETALLKLEDSFEEKLEAAGTKVLKNEKDTIQIKTMTVDVYGVLNSNPSSFWSYSEKAFGNFIYENPENLKILAIHEPVLFQVFEPEFWGDLMVSGHTHGGIMRIPVLGPLYTHEDGLFPERGGAFVYGRYNTAGSPLIVSSGLENSNLLRINNQPELVIIDINKF